MRVLIVDDSEALVQRLTSRLTGVAGIEIVGHAGNALDATQKIRTAKPDVVVLDIHMPGGSGIDVLNGLKKAQFKPVVIILTNCSDKHYRKRCLANGARFFFDKSAEFDKVGEVLQTLMNTTAA